MDPAFDWEHEQELKRLAIEEEKRLARERWDSYVKPPTLGQVGLGLDMMFAPRGTSSHLPLSPSPISNQD